MGVTGFQEATNRQLGSRRRAARSWHISSDRIAQLRLSKEIPIQVYFLLGCWNQLADDEDYGRKETEMSYLVPTPRMHDREGANAVNGTLFYPTSTWRFPRHLPTSYHTVSP
jgi:hypothetical protein